MVPMNDDSVKHDDINNHRIFRNGITVNDVWRNEECRVRSGSFWSVEDSPERKYNPCDEGEVEELTCPYGKPMMLILVNKGRIIR